MVSDFGLPAVADEELKASLAEVKPYTIVILRAGPHFEPPTDERSEGVAALVWEHGKRNYALRKAGIMPIICPIGDGSGVCGVSIFATSPEEAERIMAADPGVEKGIFTYEIHSTVSFPGSSLP